MARRSNQTGRDRERALVGAAAGLILASCAHGGYQPCLAKGGDPWVEVRSRHVLLRTDASAGRGEELAREFEQIHHAFATLAFRSGDPPEEPVEVYMIQDEAAARRVGLDDRTFGYFVVGPERRQLTVFRRELDPYVQRTYQHELAHRFLRHHLPQAPRWLHEGIASFWETLRFQGGEALIGRPPYCQLLPDKTNADRYCDYTEIRAAPRPTLEALVHGPFPVEPKDEVHGAYAMAWAVVHELHSRPEGRDAFQRLVEDLATDASMKAAWTTLAATVDLADLERRATAKFAHVSHLAYWEVPYQPPEDFGAIEVRPLSDPQIHLAFARILRRADPKTAGAEAQAALDHDPNLPEAHHLLGLLAKDPRAAEAHLRRAVAAAPKDPRYQEALTELLVNGAGGEGDAAHQEVEKLARMAASAEGLAAIASHYRLRKQVDRALPFVGRGLRRDPGCIRCLVVLGELRADQRDFAAAAAAQQQAIDLAGEGGPSAAMVERLRTYTAQTSTRSVGE